MKKQSEMPMSRDTSKAFMRRLLTWSDFLILPNSLVAGFLVGMGMNVWLPEGASPNLAILMFGSFNFFLILSIGGLRLHVRSETERFFAWSPDDPAKDLRHWFGYSSTMAVYFVANTVILIWNAFILSNL